MPAPHHHSRFARTTDEAFGCDGIAITKFKRPLFYGLQAKNVFFTVALLVLVFAVAVSA